MGKHANSTSSKILHRIRGHGRGWVFTPDCFSDFGTRSAIDIALMRHRKSGVIRRLGRGYYDYPKIDPEFGELHPSSDEIVDAIADRDGTKFQPTGAYAANLLGLTTQVPKKIAYLTDGRSRIVQAGKYQIILRHASARNMATAGRISGLVIQALRHIGQENVGQKEIDQINSHLDDDAREQLMEDIRFAPIWVADIFRILVDQRSTAEVT